MIEVKKFPLVSDQIEYDELQVIIRELCKALENTDAGDVVELGCYTGTTSLFIARQLSELSEQRTFHAYDSFSGLPEKVAADASPAGNQFVKGELLASKQQFIKHFRHAGLRLPIIHKVWFEQLASTDLPEKIAFAFLDGDFYTSIRSSLLAIEPLLVTNAIIVIDDYQSEALPGACRATDEWATRHGLNVRAEQSLAVIQWP